MESSQNEWILFFFSQIKFSKTLNKMFGAKMNKFEFNLEYVYVYILANIYNLKIKI